MIRKFPEQKEIQMNNHGNLASATRYIGQFLLLIGMTEKALLAAPTRDMFERELDKFGNESRFLLSRLREETFTPDGLFLTLFQQINIRLQSLAKLVPISTTIGGLIRLLPIELRVLASGIDGASEDIKPLMDSIWAVPSRDLRDEVTTRFIELHIMRADPETAIELYLSYITNQLADYMFNQRFGRTMRLLNNCEVFRKSPRFQVAASVGRRWEQITKAMHYRLALLAGNIYMAKVGLPAIRSELERARPPGQQIKVVRSMGGLGDLLRMTSGLKALSQRLGQPIEFAVPRRFMSLFARNPYVSVQAVETLDSSWYRNAKILDMTDCPAAYVESRTAPDVKANRTELYAVAMGVSIAELDRAGRKPIFEPSQNDTARAILWLRERGLEPKGFIAIQAAAAESYRNWVGMPHAAETLAANDPVIVLHDIPLPEYILLATHNPNIHLAFALDIALGLAILCLAKVIVAPDSGLGHIAGAQNIPCVNIYGPTDGELITRDYPNTIAITRRHDMPCSPCWRNQFGSCQLTKALSSPCLDTLDPELVISAAKRLLAGEPAREHRRIKPVSRRAAAKIARARSLAAP